VSVVNAAPLLLGDEGYNISRSVRLRRSASAYFNRTPGSASNQKTHTISFWTKWSALTSDANMISFGNTLSYQITWGNSGRTLACGSQILGVSNPWFVDSIASYRDPSAWYHIVIAVDTTQATASNRVKLYVNGAQITSFGTANYPTLNYDTGANSATSHSIGRREDNAQYYDGYLTEINWIDGQQLTPSSFGETNAITGVWQPKKYGGTYGTNGFYLNFSDNSNNTAATIGKDYSGNGNNWTPNNISVTAGATYDSMLDVPTLWADGGNGRGNYCIINPLDLRPGSNAVSRTNGNLNVSYATGGSVAAAMGSIVLPSGKWYAEASYTGGTMANAYIGVTRSDYLSGVSANTGQVFYIGNGNKRINGTDTAYGASFAVNDIIGMAVDTAAGTIEFFKNNTSQGVITSTTYIQPNLVCFADVQGSTSDSLAHWWNFGQRPFAYTPPTGFKALNTQNFPEPTIKKGNQWFDATLYTGNGSTQSIVNAGGTQPDLVWIKNRSNTGGFSHALFDAVRGTPRRLSTNLTEAENTTGSFGQVSAFNSNGFTVATGTTSFGETGANGDTYVGWQWKEGTTPGFDIVAYTGTGANRTVAHSLGVAPAMVIVKKRTGTSGSGFSDWTVWHSAYNAANITLLNTTNAFFSNPTCFNSTAPTSSVFSLGTNTLTNENTGTFIAYLFSDVSGFSKFGSYTGNGNADGPFVFCGFRPRWVMIKRTDTTADWEVLDTARDLTNGMGALLNPNLSNADKQHGHHHSQDRGA